MEGELNKRLFEVSQSSSQEEKKISDLINKGQISDSL